MQTFENTIYLGSSHGVAIARPTADAWDLTEQMVCEDEPLHRLCLRNKKRVVFHKPSSDELKKEIERVRRELYSSGQSSSICIWKLMQLARVELRKRTKQIVEVVEYGPMKPVPEPVDQAERMEAKQFNRECRRKRRVRDWLFHSPGRNAGRKPRSFRRDSIRFAA